MSVPADIVWEPTTDDVARLLRARTKDSDGVEVGSWTEDTRPTLSEVQDIIRIAVDDLTSVIGATVPDACARGARGTAALLAAMLVELSYFPEQVRADRSAYSEYRTLYDKHVQLLQECVQEGGGGGDAGGVGSSYHNVPAVPLTTANYYAKLGGIAPILTVDATFTSPLTADPPLIDEVLQAGRLLRAFVYFQAETDVTNGGSLFVQLLANRPGESARLLASRLYDWTIAAGTSVNLNMVDGHPPLLPGDVLSFTLGEVGNYRNGANCAITAQVSYATAGKGPPFASLLGPWGDLPGDYWPEPENPANWVQPFQPPREPPLAEDVPVGDMPASGEVLE